MTEDLVRRAQRGENEAFEALVRPRYPVLWNIARRMLRDPYAAEDAVQDAVVRSWRDIRALRDPERFDPWLHRNVVNSCLDHLRRGRRRPIEIPVLPDEASDEPAHGTRVADREEIETALFRLSPEHRAVLVLRHYLGYEPIEIAEILGVPSGTVHSRLHNGAKAMRQALALPTGAKPTLEHIR